MHTPTATALPTALATPTPAAAPAAVVNGNTVTVVGAGSLTVKPDTAFLTIGASANRGSVADTIAQMSADAARLTAALAANGVSRDDITTTSLYTGPNWANGVQQGYTASTSFFVRVRDISRTGILIGRAAAAVGNDFQSSGVSFSRQDTAALLGPASAAALASAQTHAADWAKLAGRTLGAIRSISEVPNLVPSSTQPGGASGAGGGGGVPIETEMWTYTLQVTVVYALA